jgi:hypothetical protein
MKDRIDNPTISYYLDVNIKNEVHNECVRVTGYSVRPKVFFRFLGGEHTVCAGFMVCSKGICESSFCSLWPSLGSTPVSDIEMVDLVSSFTSSEMVVFAFLPRVDMEATASRTVTAGQKGFLFDASRLLRRGV